MTHPSKESKKVILRTDEFPGSLITRQSNPSFSDIITVPLDPDAITLCLPSER